jgi:DNA-binding PadR family transcriptional regulator
MNDFEPYEISRVVDSVDDRPIVELTESGVEMLRRIFPGCHDPKVHEFSDLTHSDQACVEGRDDELLEALEAGLEMTIEKGRVFKDLLALKRWLQAFEVI